MSSPLYTQAQGAGEIEQRGAYEDQHTENHTVDDNHEGHSHKTTEGLATDLLDAERLLYCDSHRKFEVRCFEVLQEMISREKKQLIQNPKDVQLQFDLAQSYSELGFWMTNRRDDTLFYFFPKLMKQKYPNDYEIQDFLITAADEYFLKAVEIEEPLLMGKNLQLETRQDIYTNYLQNLFWVLDNAVSRTNLSRMPIIGHSKEKRQEVYSQADLKINTLFQRLQKVLKQSRPLGLNEEVRFQELAFYTNLISSAAQTTRSLNFVNYISLDFNEAPLAGSALYKTDVYMRALLCQNFDMQTKKFKTREAKNLALKMVQNSRHHYEYGDSMNRYGQITRILFQNYPFTLRLLNKSLPPSSGPAMTVQELCAVPKALQRLAP